MHPGRSGPHVSKETPTLGVSFYLTANIQICEKAITHMATVETRGIRKRYGNVAAVNGIDLSVKDGEFLVLLGPSGCGKSTLLRMIAGFEVPSEGELLIGGTVVNDLPPRARQIAMVFQSYALYPHMTVYKNIAFPLKGHHVEKTAIPKKEKGAPLTFGFGP